MGDCGMKKVENLLEYRIELTARERDTIIAALRRWQDHLTDTEPDYEGLLAIAEDFGPALDVTEIDTLCERINK
jgi:hypothetical protein